jgi:hypothetical protein
MIVECTMMMEGDLDAADRLLKRTGELDLYHGFAMPPFSLPAEGSPQQLAGPRREMPAPRRKFPGCKALKSLEMRKELAERRSRKRRRGG